MATHLPTPSGRAAPLPGRRFLFLGLLERPPQSGLEPAHRFEELLRLRLEVLDKRLQRLQEAAAVPRVCRLSLRGRLEDVRPPVLRIATATDLLLLDKPLDHRRERRRRDPELARNLAGGRGADDVEPARHGVLRRRHVASLDDPFYEPSR